MPEPDRLMHTLALILGALVAFSALTVFAIVLAAVLLGFDKEED